MEFGGRVRFGLAVLAATAALLLSACGSGGAHGVTSGDARTPRPDMLVQVQSVNYTTGRDGGQSTALVATPRAGASRGCVIWMNGLGASRQDASQIWQYLALIGLTTVSIDFHGPATGGSTDTPYEQTVTSPAALAQSIRGTVADLRKLVDYLETQPYCWKNVAYAGISLGGVTGTILTATDHRVKAAVIMSTPATFRTLLTTPGSQILPGLAHHPAQLSAALRILSPLDPAHYIGRVAPRPVLLISGRGDTDVVPANWRALEAAAHQPKTIVNYDGGHDPTTGHAASANGQAVASFLLRHIVEPTYGISGNANGTFIQG